MIKGHKEVEVDIRLSYPISNQDNELFGNISIEDRASGVVLADIDLTKGQLAELIAGRSQTVRPTAQIPYADNFAKVGKVKEHKTWNPPKELTDGVWREASNDMHDAAMDQVFVQGYQTYSWIKHNFGWQLHMYRWVDEPLPEDELTRLHRQVKEEGA